MRTSAEDEAMAERRMKPANSDEVRDWANENGWVDQYDRPVSDRGRLPTSLISDFNKSMRKHRVEYNPVARGDSQPPRSSDEYRGRRPRTEVAVKEPVRASRPARRAQDEDDTPAPRQRRETIKVQAERGDGKNVASTRRQAQSSASVADFAQVLLASQDSAPDGKIAVLHANTTYVLEFQDA